MVWGTRWEGGTKAGDKKQAVSVQTGTPDVFTTTGLSRQDPQLASCLLLPGALGKDAWGGGSRAGTQDMRGCAAAPSWEEQYLQGHYGSQERKTRGGGGRRCARTSRSAPNAPPSSVITHLEDSPVNISLFPVMP